MNDSDVAPTTPAPTLGVRLALGVLAVAIAAVIIPVHATVYGLPVALAFFLGLAQAGAVPLAASRPRLAATAGITGWIITAALSREAVGVPWPWPVASLIAVTLMIAVIAARHPWRYAVAAWLTAVAGTIAMIASTPDRYGELDTAVTNGIVFAANAGGVLAIVLLLAQRREIRAQLARERRSAAEEQGRRELVEERARIARELHDVVAHGVSVIQVQASSAKYRLPEAGEAAAAEFDEIAATARGVLTEMRQLLGVLRGDGGPDGEAELGPQPGLFDLPELVATSERAGLPVSLSWDASSDTPATVGLSVYRIVQESLSNVVRHAPGAVTRVVVAREPWSITVTVENDAPDTSGPGAAVEPGGHGLRGMRERVSLLGGQLEHGPSESGGYRVRAALPMPATAAAGGDAR